MAEVRQEVGFADAGDEGVTARRLTAQPQAARSLRSAALFVLTLAGNLLQCAI
jgi:hypothetical protein